MTDDPFAERLDVPRRNVGWRGLLLGAHLLKIGVPWWRVIAVLWRGGRLYGKELDDGTVDFKLEVNG